MAKRFLNRMGKLVGRHFPGPLRHLPIFFNIAQGQIWQLGLRHVAPNETTVLHALPQTHVQALQRIVEQMIEFTFAGRSRTKSHVHIGAATSLAQSGNAVPMVRPQRHQAQQRFADPVHDAALDMSLREHRINRLWEASQANHYRDQNAFQ